MRIHFQSAAYPATAFIRAVCRIHTDGDLPLALGKQSLQQTDWPFILNWTENHGVQQLMYHGLRTQVQRAHIPGEVWNTLERNYQQNALRNQQLMAECKRLASYLGDDVVLLKGIDLAGGIYPDPALRPMSDIDLLVRKDAVLEAWQKVQEMGYVSFEGSSGKSRVHLKLEHKHLPSLYSEGLPIEIHWNLFKGPENYPFTELAWKSLIRRDEHIPLYGLSPDINLIYLCVHCYRHLLLSDASFKLLCDINELIRAVSNQLDWDSIESMAKEFGLDEAVGVVLNHVHQRLATPMPSFMHQHSFPGQSAQYQQSTEEAMGNNHFLLKYRLLSSPREKLVYFFRTLFPQRGWIERFYGHRLFTAYLRYWRQCLRKVLQPYLLNN